MRYPRPREDPRHPRLRISIEDAVQGLLYKWRVGLDDLSTVRFCEAAVLRNCRLLCGRHGKKEGGKKRRREGGVSGRCRAGEKRAPVLSFGRGRCSQGWQMELQLEKNSHISAYLERS